MTDAYGELTRVYPGRTLCSRCGRACGIGQPAYEIADVVAREYGREHHTGIYCRTCAGKELLDLSSAAVGLDVPAMLVDRRDLDRLEGDSERAHALAKALLAGESVAPILARMGYDTRGM